MFKLIFFSFSLAVILCTAISAETTEIKRKIVCVAKLNGKEAGNMEVRLDKTAQIKSLFFTGNKDEKFFAKVALELVDGVLGDTPSLMIGMSDRDNKVQKPFAVSNMNLPIESKEFYMLNTHYDLNFQTVTNQIRVLCEYSRTPNK